ncbi:hypothetical protein ACFL1E_03270 [Candidatus Omnitrophota bacterium]
MKKEYLLGILFFSGLWGASEAGLGGYLYRAQIPYASVSLTVIAFIILTIAKMYLPQRHSATVIAAITMLYKFLNAPFYGCHLLAIFLLGVSYDLVFGFMKTKNKVLLALISTYVGYALFAFTITYIVRYSYWIQEGLPKILRYIGTSGTLAALINCAVVPASFKVGQILKQQTINPFEFQSKIATSSISVATLGLWFLGLTKCF